MGQYHLTCNLDKREYLHPHKLGDGLKLMEFGCSAMGTMTALAVLLSEQNGRGGGDLHADDALSRIYIGRWAGDRIAIIGDYWEPDDPIAGKTTTPWDDLEADESQWVDVSQIMIRVLSEDPYLEKALAERWQPSS